ncbi:MAG TPA: gliding motility-associated C-terminal domain-containing protein, partial [Bacteroidia bacterium]|nr:gliding motility-associated C-terminal domain-containing protein [Bacteroidia bacterium]
APNGKNKIWLPITHFIDKKEYSVRVFNRWGNMVFETSDDKVGWDGDGAPNGIYAYVITYKNARGEYQELKGTLMLL